MELDKIFSLIDKAEKSSFNKIEIQIGDTKLSLDRSTSAAAVPAAPIAEKSELKPVKEEVKKEHFNKEDIVMAPISGVFYVAKAPGEPPFVTAGDSVKKGETICIIEAMKTMNEIVAPKAGVIESVLVGDCESVTAKQPLFKYAEGK